MHIISPCPISQCVYSARLRHVILLAGPRHTMQNGRSMKFFATTGYLPPQFATRMSSLTVVQRVSGMVPVSCVKLMNVVDGLGRLPSDSGSVLEKRL